MQINTSYSMQYSFISKYTNRIYKQFLRDVLQTSCTSMQCGRIVLFNESHSPVPSEAAILDCSAKCRL